MNSLAIEGTEFIVSGPTEIAVEIIKGRTITYSSTGNGTLMITSDGKEIENNSLVLKGSSVTVKAIPAANSQVNNVLVNNEDKTAECISETGYEFVVDEHTNIVASFILNSFNFTYTYNVDGGNVVVRNGGAIVGSDTKLNYGTELAINVTPAGGYKLKAILINDIDKTGELLPSGDNNFRLTIVETTAMEIVFEIEKSYTLTYNTPSNGTMTVKLNGQEAESGSSVLFGDYLELIFTPETGFELSTLVINNMDYKEFVEDNYTQYEIKGDVIINATFAGPSSIEELALDGLVSYVNVNGDVVVTGAPLGSKVTVYSITGSALAVHTVSNAEEIIPLNMSMLIYIVKVNDGNNSVVRKVTKK